MTPRTPPLDGHPPGCPTFARRGLRPGAISPGRIQKHRVTPQRRVFAVRHVSRATHRQGLAPRSWLSCSRPPDLPAVPGPDLGSGFACRQAESSPRRPTLRAPDGPASRGRDLLNHGYCHDIAHPLCAVTASVTSDRGLSASPAICPTNCTGLVRTHASDRTLGLPAGVSLAYEASDAGYSLRQRASVELDEHVSMHPALRDGTHRMVSPIP